MTAGLLTTIAGIAFVVSLNPSLFFAQFYLLATPKPTVRIVSYIVGILIVNFFGGLLILGGARALVANILESVNPNTLYGAQFLLGVVILVFGLWMRIGVSDGQDVEVKKPRSLHPFSTLLLGMGVMINELTTALPYFVAIERIAGARLDTFGNLAVMVVYNVIFSLPLWAFLAFFLRYRQRFAAQLQRITTFITRWMPRLVKYGSIVFGALLLLDAAAYLIAALRV